MPVALPFTVDSFMDVVVLGLLLFSLLMNFAAFFLASSRSWQNRGILVLCILQLFSVLLIGLRLVWYFTDVLPYLVEVDTLLGGWICTLLSLTTLMTVYKMRPLFPRLSLWHLWLLGFLFIGVHTVLLGPAYMQVFGLQMDKLIEQGLVCVVALSLGFSDFTKFYITKRLVAMSNRRRMSFVKEHETKSPDVEQHERTVKRFVILLRYSAIQDLLSVIVLGTGSLLETLDKRVLVIGSALMMLHFPLGVVHYLGMQIITFPDHAVKRKSVLAVQSPKKPQPALRRLSIRPPAPMNTILLPTPTDLIPEISEEKDDPMMQPTQMVLPQVSDDNLP